MDRRIGCQWGKSLRKPPPLVSGASLVVAILPAALGCIGTSSGMDSDPFEVETAANVDADGDGWTPDEGDCDDHDAEVNPAEDESFFGEYGVDGRDNDCDGLIDNHTASFDDDGDGWSESAGDCDDADADVGPASAEQTNTAVDENCDGSLAAPTLIADAAVATWWGDTDNTGVGNAAGSGVAFAGDVNGDGTPDVLVSAPTGQLEGGPRAAYLLAGPAAGGGSLAAGSLATFERSPTSGLFVFMNTESAGDVNGDGFADVLLSDHYANGVAPDGGDVGQAGRVALFFGPVSGVRSIVSADVLIVGQASSEMAGIGLACGGDLDGDGLADVVVGTLWGIHVYGGPLAGEITTAEADVSLAGAGYPVERGGDTNGDGHLDLLVGSEDDGGTGKAFVAMGPFTADSSLTSVSATLAGDHERDLTGRALSSAGDVDADGFDDVLVGAPGAGDSGGSAYLLLGPFSGSTSIGTSADTIWNPELGAPRLGASVAPSGGADLDEFGGALIGAPAEPYPDLTRDLIMPGKLYVFTDPPAGEVSAGDATTMFVGPQSGDGTGYSAAGGVDLDGDNVPDMVVGAPFDGEHGTETGKVYVLSGARP